jgi:hypothetical protein
MDCQSGIPMVVHSGLWILGLVRTSIFPGTPRVNNLLRSHS